MRICFLKGAILGPGSVAAAGDQLDVDTGDAQALIAQGIAYSLEAAVLPLRVDADKIEFPDGSSLASAGGLTGGNGSLSLSANAPVIDFAFGSTSTADDLPTPAAGHVYLGAEADDDTLVVAANGNPYSYVALQNTEVQFSSVLVLPGNLVIHGAAASAIDLVFTPGSGFYTDLPTPVTGHVILGTEGSDENLQVSVNGAPYAAVALQGTAVEFTGLRVDTGPVVLPALPTTDPQVAGQLWADAANGYVLKVSQGA